MAETPQDPINSLTDTEDDGKQLERPKAKAAALLLMPAPVWSLADELDRLSALGPHFYNLNMGVRMELMDDPNADHLRTTLMKFNVPMKAASGEIRSSFLDARNFYVHTWDELRPTKEGPGPITKEMVSMLLEPDFQAMAVKYAVEAATRAAKAAKIIREKVIPILPQLEDDLEDYVDDYESRFMTREERQKSWFPSVIQDVLWGPLSPTPCRLEEVTKLPKAVAEANNLLRQLPAFLDNLELHCRRLSELNNQQILDLGYTNFDDFTRLYRDRLLCNQALAHMGHSWFDATRAFAMGTTDILPLEAILNPKHSYKTLWVLMVYPSFTA